MNDEKMQEMAQDAAFERQTEKEDFESMLANGDGEICGSCSGSGEGQYDGSYCSECDGLGLTKKGE